MKTNTTHTPGPWTTLAPENPSTVKSVEGSHIAECLTDANARLIASAPELFTALHGLMRQAAQDAETYTADASAPIWAWIAEAADALEKAQPGATK